MALGDLPPSAAWRHVGGRVGSEVAFFTRQASGWLMAGSTSAVEERVPWHATYEVHVAADRTTRRVLVALSSAGVARAVEVVADGTGRWWVDGTPRDDLDGCLDLDLEFSVVTNTLPVRRGPTEFDYTAPVFGAAFRLSYAEDLLVRDYPGLAVREH